MSVSCGSCPARSPPTTSARSISARSMRPGTGSRSSTRSRERRSPLMAHSAHLLELIGARKRFAGSVALDNVDFDLRAGEVHVLFGENGAGKSTLINVITGNVSPDAGQYLLADADVPHMTPRLARASGIASVFQEFSLIPDLNVAENLFLGREPNRATFMNARTMREAAAK